MAPPFRGKSGGRPNSERSPPHGAGGFALVEALVSLVIVAMISLLLIEGMSTGRRVWERQDARDAAGEALEGAQSALRDRIEQVYPALLYDQTPPYVDFAGDPNEVRFLANPPQAGRPAPLRRYRLALGATGDLVLASISDVAGGGAAPSSQTLLRGVRQLDVAYFGAADPDRARRWRTTWRNQPDPPELVRVRVSFGVGDRRLWPDLIVRVGATVDTDCVLNPLDGRCKGRP